MKSRSQSPLSALVFVAALAANSNANAAKPAPSAPAAAAAPKNAFQDDYVKLLDEVEKKLLSLEETTPQDKFK